MKTQEALQKIELRLDQIIESSKDETDIKTGVYGYVADLYRMLGLGFDHEQLVKEVEKSLVEYLKEPSSENRRALLENYSHSLLQLIYWAKTSKIS
jgi:hypothetical protein